MAEPVIHIVGAGLAGLSTAVHLTARRRRVVIHEAMAAPGGRCRSLNDPRLERVIDNGNHLVLTGNRSVARYLARIGARERLSPEPEARFAFVDLADGRRWSLAMNRGPLPWWIWAPGRRIPETGAGDYLAGIRLALAGSGQTVAEAIPGRGLAWTRFWEPLTLAAINRRPEDASAGLLWAVLAETFARGGEHCRPMLAPEGLGAALISPAVAWLSARGAAIRYRRVLRAVERGEGRATALGFSDGEERLGPEDRVVLALPPSRLAAVLPDSDPPADDCAILNAFFRLPESAAARLAEAPAILGVLSATTHWIFRRSDVVSVTVSAADRMGVLTRPSEELIAQLWKEARRALGIAPETGYLAARVNKEKRATFDQSPAGVAKRPKPRTPLANLFLAGDATDTGLPATIEGAIRSGETAAALVA